jgi:hypothetical protein
MMLAPWLAWLAAITSLVLLLTRSAGGSVHPLTIALLWTWFAAAGYLQFFGQDVVTSTAGLAAQTVLAVGLLIASRLDA